MPGFIIPRGSIAALIWHIASSSAPPRQVSIRSDIRRPIPCSTEKLPSKLRTTESPMTCGCFAFHSLMRLCPCQIACAQYIGRRCRAEKKNSGTYLENEAVPRGNKSAPAVIFDTNIAIRMCFNASELIVVAHKKALTSLDAYLPANCFSAAWVALANASFRGRMENGTPYIRQAVRARRQGSSHYLGNVTIFCAA